MPEQVQDFYPTPSTLSTCMYYTGVDPRTMQKVYVPKSPHEKAMQRALIQYRNPELYDLVIEALHKAGRSDLIGFGPKCLVRPRKMAGEAGKPIKKPAERNRKKDQKVRMVRKDKTILNTEEELKGKIRRNLSEMFILRRIENR